VIALESTLLKVGEKFVAQPAFENH
jgi:hypothetical protein